MDTKHQPSPLTIAAVALFGIFSVSTSSIFIRFSQAEHVNSFVIAAARLVIASLVLAPMAVSRHREELKGVSKQDLLFGALSGIFLALHFFSWITSLEYTTIVNSVVLVTTTPLWVALLAPIFLKEKFGKALMFGMLLALFGGVVIAFGEPCVWENGLRCEGITATLNGGSFFGNFLATFGAWMAAGYILIGRRLRSKLSLIPYIFIVYGFAAVFSLSFILIAGYPILGFASSTYLWLALLGLVPQLFGHSSFNWALGFLNASLVSVMLLGEPIGSTILGFIVFNEIPKFATLIGGALILGGIFISSLEGGKK